MQPRESARLLPAKPGVYLFHDAAGDILYIGKAVNLRNRVRSYFQSPNRLDGAKQRMVEQIRQIEHILVQSETEALLLESTLIKKHRPKYNILLKDDKNFQYIKIALAETYPSVSTVRRVTLDGSRYFGPYTSGLSVRRTLRLLKRLFPYKSCPNPPEVPCFDFQLNRCLGHALGPNSLSRYQTVIARLIRFLEGHTGQTLKNLDRDMRAAARRRDFESAAIFRDRLQALRHVLEDQAVVSPRGGHFDVLGLARNAEVAAITLFQVRQGKLVQRDNFILQHAQHRTDIDLVSAFIEQYYSQSTNHPRALFVPLDVPPTLGQPLALRITRARRGLKRTLVRTATDNARDHLEHEQVRWLSETARAELGLDELAAALKLPARPHRIEMYDISNFQGAYAVGSMVVFEHGRPAPATYRKFKIRRVRGIDDFRMLAEVLQRRFTHTDRGWPRPDLILLDGGKPQLSVVLDRVKNLPAGIVVAALAKQLEELFLPKRTTPLRLLPGSAGLLLLQRIRDEAHRFAIGYYRQRHRGELTRSVLDTVPGLTPALKKQLLRAFGSLAAIRRASDNDLAKLINRRTIERLRDAIG